MVLLLHFLLELKSIITFLSFSVCNLKLLFPFQLFFLLRQVNSFFDLFFYVTTELICFQPKNLQYFQFTDSKFQTNFSYNYLCKYFQILEHKVTFNMLTNSMEDYFIYYYSYYCYEYAKMLVSSFIFGSYGIIENYDYCSKVNLICLKTF